MLCCVDRKQETLWAAGQEYRQGLSNAAAVKPQSDGCIVTIVNNLSLDDNQNCEMSAVAVDNNDNMACVFIAISMTAGILLHELR